MCSTRGGDPDVRSRAPTSRMDPEMVMTAAAPAETSSTSSAPLLDVRELKTHFFTRRGVAKVLDGLNFQVGKGEIVGLVGESGSGKSVTGFSIVRLLKNPGKIVGGQILFEGRDLTKLSDDQIQDLRGREISMVFQNPRSSLNPVLSVG